jgi:hypothetical protein
MMRTILVAVMAASILLSGCFRQQTVLPALPPEEDPNKLVEEIATRGQGPVAGELSEPEPQGPRPVEDAILVTAGIGGRVALTAVVLAFAAAYAMAGGQHPPPNNTENGFGAVLQRIWTFE